MPTHAQYTTLASPRLRDVDKVASHRRDSLSMAAPACSPTELTSVTELATQTTQPRPDDIFLSSPSRQPNESRVLRETTSDRQPANRMLAISSFQGKKHGKLHDPKKTDGGVCRTSTSRPCARPLLHGCFVGSMMILHCRYCNNQSTRRKSSVVKQRHQHMRCVHHHEMTVTTPLKK